MARRRSPAGSPVRGDSHPSGGCGGSSPPSSCSSGWRSPASAARTPASCPRCSATTPRRSCLRTPSRPRCSTSRLRSPRSRRSRPSCCSRATSADPRPAAAFTAFAQGIPNVEVPVKGAAPRKVGDFLAPGPVVVVPSKDGKAALALVNFDANQVVLHAGRRHEPDPGIGGGDPFRRPDVRRRRHPGVRRRTGGHDRGLRQGVRRHRRHAADRGADRRPGDPAHRLPQPRRAVLRARDVAVRAVAGQRRRVLPGEERRDQAQRAEPGHPVDPRHRRRHGLRPAPGLAVPGGAAPARRPVRGDVAGVAADDRAGRRVRGHRHPGPALPVAERTAVDQGPRPGRCDRHRRVAAVRHDVPARAARAARPQQRGRARPLGVLAVDPARGHQGPGDARDLGPGQPARRRAAARRRDRERRRPADPGGVPAHPQGLGDPAVGTRSSPPSSR